jgi:hypothetical protein
MPPHITTIITTMTTSTATEPLIMLVALPDSGLCQRVERWRYIPSTAVPRPNGSGGGAARSAVSGIGKAHPFKNLRQGLIVAEQCNNAAAFE